MFAARYTSAGRRPWGPPGEGRETTRSAQARGVALASTQAGRRVAPTMAPPSMG